MKYQRAPANNRLLKLIKLNLEEWSLPTEISEMVNSHFGQSLHPTENVSGQRLQVIVSQAPNG